jgi:hypothetical protein
VRLRILALLVAGGIIGGDSLLAQKPEGRSAVSVSFSETIMLIGNTSATYFEAFYQRQRNGVLFLSPEETGQLKVQIDKIRNALKPFTGDKHLSSGDLSEQNKAALSAALLCANCSGKMPEGGSVKFVTSRHDLQTLLLARCEAILSLLPADPKSNVPQDVLLSLEVHFSYLRQIAIAYAGLE